MEERYFSMQKILKELNLSGRQKGRPQADPKRDMDMFLRWRNGEDIAKLGAEIGKTKAGMKMILRRVGTQLIKSGEIEKYKE